MSDLRRPGLVVAALILAVACGDDGGSVVPETSGPESTTAPEIDPASFPDVVAVEVVALGDARYDVAVTVSSPYDSPDRYADAWRVLDPDGNELGVRELTHHHAGEQPFTRSLELDIPEGVAEIIVEARDLANGWGGDTATATVPAA